MANIEKALADGYPKMILGNDNYRATLVGIQPLIDSDYMGIYRYPGGDTCHDLEEIKAHFKEVHSADNFDYSKAKPGELVEAAFVMDAMDLLQPACMRLSCAQVGEPYSHRQDPETGNWRATYSTFKCLSGDWNDGVWEYCGNCFFGETTERGSDPVYV
jgi:hypothetical protein